MLRPKEYLVAQARFKATGCTIHRLNNLLAVYMAAAETFNMAAQADEFKSRCEKAFESSERELVAFCLTGKLRVSCAEPSNPTEVLALC